ncbi:MAG: type II toxin-antitoxin system VapC family toxin [Ignavibacteriales bacterium]|nr:type II toxin-antitoxin system VapC family toxin [Ignavibacteriales bacterium]
MYLLDSNIPLELFLEQARANEVEEFFRVIPTKNFSVTEFSLYSICLTLVYRKRTNAVQNFLKDILKQDGISLIRLSVSELEKVFENVTRFNLDFDDAYQYTAAEKYDLHIVSFDTDFDTTPRGRMTPQQVLKTITKQT